MSILPPMETFELVVIGGGSAGLTAASFAHRLGARVALLERERTGGDCTWTGCVPSKTLIKIASVAQQLRTAERYGLPSVPSTPVDLGRVMDEVQAVVRSIYDDESPEALRAEGIEVRTGGAVFLDPHTVACGGRSLRGDRFIVCTGARPSRPPIDGLDAIEPLDHESVWSLRELPPRLAVIGGGPIGCELAQCFRRLGSEVSILDAAPRLLPRDEPEASAVLEARFEAEGVAVLVGAGVRRAWREADGVHLSTGEAELVVDRVLVATGRVPNLEALGLDAAGVRWSERGLPVDEALRTNVPHVFGAGDCLGGPQFTHYAGWQGAMAARNALLPLTSKGLRGRVPWTTYTDPEVAHAGQSEAEARETFGEDVVSFTWPMARVDRARTDRSEDGFVKIVHLASGRVLGATVVAPRAGEMIQEWILAIDHRLSVGDVLGSMHVYPSYAFANQQAASKIRVGQLLDGRAGDALKSVARWLR